jgi:hypothetical protein
MTLGLAACGGKYDVGSGETGGQAGEGGADDPGSGGSSTGGAAGTSNEGGTAGVSTGGFAGAAIGGTAGVSAGGSSGMDACRPAEGLPGYTAATADVVWDRLCTFFYGGPREPFAPLPETTTVPWVREMVLAILRERNPDDGRAPAGLENFMRSWAGFDDDESVEFWAREFVHPMGNFSGFFASVDDRVSFVSDRDFLVSHPGPTVRGAQMRRNFLCGEVSPPPDDSGIHGGPLMVPPGVTRRQAMEEAKSSPACAGCHSLLDPLGFSLEHYDALGDYRTTENGQPIDSSGSYDGEGDCAHW